MAAEYVNDILKRQEKEAPNFIYVDDTKNVLELLEKGLVDAGIGDESSNFYLLEKNLMFMKQKMQYKSFIWKRCSISS